MTWVFAVNPDWTTEANRIGCFDGVFSLVSCGGLGGGNLGIFARAHYLKLFPAFPERPHQRRLPPARALAIQPHRERRRQR